MKWPARFRRHQFSVPVVLLFTLYTSASRGQRVINVPSRAADKSSQFDTATIKPTNITSSGWKMEFTTNGFTARGVTMRMLLDEAFDLRPENPIVDEPSWVNKERFDIEAQADASSAPSYRELDIEQRRVMLRGLLADRFKLLAHLETRTARVTELILAKNGPILKVAQDIDPSEIKGMNGLVVASRQGLLEVKSMSLDDFSKLLDHAADSIVINKTGLTSLYDITLRWSPDALTNPNALNPDLGSALKDQLGLQMRPAKLPISVFAIERIEQPSPN